MPDSPGQFPTEAAGLPEARAPEVLELPDGGQLQLRIAPVTKQLGEATVRMLAYGGSIPGPTLRVVQGSKLVVNVVNEGDLEATVHWHGLRLDNRYDGTTHVQPPIPIGGSFTYVLEFPDPGAYWYHPHIREDYGQEMGLYGNVVVVPTERDYWPPVHRELALALDDILLEHGRVAPFSRSEPTHVAMGRFGNVMLVNGETALTLAARQGEVVRLYLTNVANTRFFELRLPGARMKLVGGDSGRCEREEFVEHLLITPSERLVVDVMFDEPGVRRLEHHAPDRTWPLATIHVAGDVATPSLALPFETLRTNREMVAERARVARYREAAPDKTLALVAEMGPADMRWKLIDRATGAAGHAIDWRFRVGDQVKIRLVNEMDSAHPMPHPFHVHGAGRFLVLSRDGVVESNLAWKDTVLVSTGQTVDILLDVTHAGVWMAHCHIPEHHESGMMLDFRVDP